MENSKKNGNKQIKSNRIRIYFKTGFRLSLWGRDGLALYLQQTVQIGVLMPVRSLNKTSIQRIIK